MAKNKVTRIRKDKTKDAKKGQFKNIGTLYRAGKMSQEELNKRGWEPYLERLLKNEVNSYVESDDDIIRMKQQVVLIEEKIHYLDAVIRMINNRGFQIKNALDWLKFSHGNN